MYKILIVEDETVLRDALVQKFSGEFEVDSCPDGMSAISKAQSFGPHVVILDIMLLGSINGEVVIKELRNIPQFEKMPIIVLTNSAEDKRMALMRSGASEYLIKSNTSLDQLHEVIKKFLPQN